MKVWSMENVIILFGVRYSRVLKIHKKWKGWFIRMIIMTICKTIVIPHRSLCNRRAKVGETQKLPKIWKRLAYLDDHDPLAKRIVRLDCPLCNRNL